MNVSADDLIGLLNRVCWQGRTAKCGACGVKLWILKTNDESKPRLVAVDAFARDHFKSACPKKRAS